MENLTRKIAIILAQTNHIKEEDIEICRYGIEIFILSVAEYAAVIVASILMGIFKETVLFLCAFLPVRIYGGGYHADTRLRCFLILVFVYILFSAALYSRFLYSCEYLIAAIPLFTMAAVSAWAPLTGKSVNKRERRFYRRISLCTAAVELIILISAVAFDFYGIYAYTIGLGAFTAFASLSAGKIKSFIREKENDIN